MIFFQDVALTTLLETALAQSGICNPISETSIVLEVDTKKKSLTIFDSGPGYSRGDLVKLGTEPCLGLEKVISLIENNEDLGLIRVFGSPFTTFWSVMMLGFKVTVSSYPLGSDEQVITIN